MPLDALCRSYALSIRGMTCAVSTELASRHLPALTLVAPLRCCPCTTENVRSRRGACQECGAYPDGPLHSCYGHIYLSYPIAGYREQLSCCIAHGTRRCNSCWSDCITDGRSMPLPGCHPCDAILMLAAQENDVPKLIELLDSGADATVKVQLSCRHLSLYATPCAIAYYLSHRMTRGPPGSTRQNCSRPLHQR